MIDDPSCSVCVCAGVWVLATGATAFQVLAASYGTIFTFVLKHVIAHFGVHLGNGIASNLRHTQ